MKSVRRGRERCFGARPMDDLHLLWIARVGELSTGRSLRAGRRFRTCWWVLLHHGSMREARTPAGWPLRQYREPYRVQLEFPGTERPECSPA